MNRRAALTWGAIVGAVVGAVTAYDVRCDRRADNSTLSSVTRYVVDVTPHGRLIFAAGLTAAGVAFHQHIVGPLARRT